VCHCLKRMPELSPCVASAKRLCLPRRRHAVQAVHCAHPMISVGALPEDPCCAHDATARSRCCRHLRPRFGLGGGRDLFRPKRLTVGRPKPILTGGTGHDAAHRDGMPPNYGETPPRLRALPIPPPPRRDTVPSAKMEIACKILVSGVSILTEKEARSSDEEPPSLTRATY